MGSPRCRDFRTCTVLQADKIYTVIAKGSASGAGAQSRRHTREGPHEIPRPDSDGGDDGLGERGAGSGGRRGEQDRGRTLLIVNTASRCGFTPQYTSLEALYQRYKGRGFEILAFPANNFRGQEPGTNAEIKEFCSLKYRTTFPLFEKISVKGKDIAPLYAYLTRESGHPGGISWNFAKFLVGPDGRVVARYDPATDPLDQNVTKRIESSLAMR